MKIFHLYIILATVLCLTLATCKHEPPEEPEPICQYDSSIEDMKKWYYFKEGTQWIYQEETTGELDTATVFNSNDGDTWFDFYVLHSKGDWIVNYYFDTSWSIYCLTSKESNCHKVFRSRGKPGNYVGEGGIFVYPNIVGNYTFSNGGACTILDILDDTLLNSTLFHEVILWDIPNDDSEDNDHSTYLIAKNIGVIKRSLQSLNENWSLIDYEIIQ